MKVFRSLSGLNPSQLTSKRVFIKWWVHEVARVFGDRIDLKETADIQVLWKALFETTRDVLHSQWIQLDHSSGERQDKMPTPSVVTPPHLLWTDLASSNYEEIPLTDMDKLVSTARNSLAAHNSGSPNKSMELHLFGHAVERILINTQH